MAWLGGGAHTMKGGGGGLRRGDAAPYIIPLGSAARPATMAHAGHGA